MSCADIIIRKIRSSIISPVSQHQRRHELFLSHKLHSLIAENAEICRCIRNRQCSLKETFLENIIAIHECDPFALGHIKAGISCSRYTAVFFKRDPEPAIFSCIFPEHIRSSI